MDANSMKKRSAVLDTPVLLYECRLADGRTERWSSHRVQAGGEEYEPRVVRHSGFVLAIWGLESGPGNSKLQLTLANTDAYGAQVETSTGWKGARLVVRFAFLNCESGTLTSEPEAVFLGICNPVEEMTETELRLSFSSRLNLERQTLPGTPIQPRCPWLFPTTGEQRAEAVQGGSRGAYSPFFSCGYSPDQPGGVGNPQAGEPYTACNRTKAECAERGMFSRDLAGRETARYGGCQFLPPTIQVRAHGEKLWRTAEAEAGTARAGDRVPLVYGTCWYQPPVIFSRSDGNYVHYEILLGSGPMEGVRRVLADGQEIPEGQRGMNLQASGWWSLVSLGERNGVFNPQFADGAGNPLGDPHGSVAVLAVAVPQSIVRGAGPRFQVLADGLKLPIFDVAGLGQTPRFTRNPAWIMLDVLRRGGWQLEELDLASFARAAEKFDELLPETGVGGQTTMRPRSETGLALVQPRSLGDLLRGLHAAAGSWLAFNKDGRLELGVEGPLSEQQPEPVEGSNSLAALGGGWPAYEFGDGQNGSDGILLDEKDRALLRFWSRPSGASANRYTLEYQDSREEFRQDSLSLVDVDDVAATGQEIAAVYPALGVIHSGQAASVLRLALHKAVRGNQYVELETGVKAFGLRPGQLITLTYGRYGIDRAQYRVLSIEPALNFERLRITAQRHQDAWYAGLSAGAGREASGEGWAGRLARPLAGKRLNADGQEEFEVSETVYAGANEESSVQLKIGYSMPPARTASLAGIPLVEAHEVELAGGELTGGHWYYAFSGVDAQGQESGLSLSRNVVIPDTATQARVRFPGWRTTSGTSKVRVYRGRTPETLRLLGEAPAEQGGFIDDGLPVLFVPPPDPNFFEAKFYWRHELLGPTAVTAWGPSHVEAASLNTTPGTFAGAILRIVSGRGQGQEATVSSNTATVVEVVRPWRIKPDGTSRFCLAEPVWRGGATTTTPAGLLEVPNRPGATIHVLGVALNSAGEESPRALAPLTRWRVTGDESGAPDFDVPGMATFAISPSVGGNLELSNLGVWPLENTRTIHSGTLVTHFVPEYSPAARSTLAEAMTTDSAFVVLNTDLPAAAGDWLRIGEELLLITDVESARRHQVQRGRCESQSAPHAPGTTVAKLERSVHSMVFSGGLFGSPASAAFSHRVPFGGRLLVGAEFYLTNAFGDGPPGRASYTWLPDGGMRFPMGGGYVLQAGGVLALRANACPPLVVGRGTTVQRVEAVAGEAPVGGALVLRVQAGQSTLTEIEFPSGSAAGLVRSPVQGIALPEGTQLTLDILEVPVGAGTWPGKDLTVLLAT